MKVLINYADIKYFQSQKLNSYTGQLIAGFDKVIEYSKKDIDTDFLNKNQEIINNNRGAGYWIWKPYIILKTLKELNYGDILFYCDSGSYFVNKIDHLIPLLDKQDIISFVLDKEHTNKRWTKRDTFILMNLDKPEYINQTQILATFQLIKKTDFTLKFYTEYLEYAQNKNIITDLPNICGLPNYKEFVDHRHDQSIFSLLIRKYNLDVFRDPSQWGNNHKLENSTYPQIIFLTRNKN